jgi:hypothetical protein
MPLLLIEVALYNKPYHRTLKMSHGCCVLDRRVGISCILLLHFDLNKHGCWERSVSIIARLV